MANVSEDPYEQLKAGARAAWSTFAPMEVFTAPPAARLVAIAGVRAGQAVLDVACGSGVVALTAARAGATVTGLDLTPELIEAARHNASTAGQAIGFEVGDAEALPYGDARFDVVLSQFGHMFAPRPELALGEMLRVLKPGGTIAFSTWPPDGFIGRMFAYVGEYLPPPPVATPPTPLWGDPNVVRERLGARVDDLHFARGTMWVTALSPAHYRGLLARASGPLATATTRLAADPRALAAFLAGYDALVAAFLEGNQVRQDFLVTRARKR